MYFMTRARNCPVPLGRTLLDQPPLHKSAQALYTPSDFDGILARLDKFKSADTDLEIPLKIFSQIQVRRQITSIHIFKIYKSMFSCIESVFKIVVQLKKHRFISIFIALIDVRRFVFNISRYIATLISFRLCEITIYHEIKNNPITLNFCLYLFLKTFSPHASQ